MVTFAESLPGIVFKLGPITRRRLVRGWVLVTVLLGLAALGWSSRLHASETAPTVAMQVEAGYDGFYREAFWLPVRVTLTNEGPPVDGQVRVSVPRNDGSVTVYARSVDLPTQSRKEFFLYVNAEGYMRQLQVDLVDGRDVLASATPRLVWVDSADLLYGVLAAHPSEFGVLGEVVPTNGVAHVAQLDLEDLPDHARALKALDVLVVSDVDTGPLSDAHRAALTAWVSGGGRLIVAGGPGWQKTAAGLGDLPPLRAEAEATVADSTGLIAFAGGAALDVPLPIAVGILTDDAIVLASQGNSPLVVVRALGYGEIVSLAFDPATAPLVGWDGTAGLYRRLLSRTHYRPSWADGFSDWMQAAEAVTTVPTTGLPAVSGLCGFLAAYVLAIGPINYVVLGRLKRREWAWFTIPALVLGFSGLAYLTGYRLHGGEPTIHRLAVIQAWPGVDVAQVDGLVGVFSPRRAAYRLHVDEAFLTRPIPPGFGRIERSTSAVLEQAAGTTIDDLRVDVAGVKAFVVEGQVPAPAIQAELELNVTFDSAHLVGHITNGSQWTLRDPVLLIPGRALPLDDLNPGQALRVDIPLGTQRASPAPWSGSPGVSASPSGGLIPTGQTTYSGACDTTVDDVVGANYYDDPESYRRYALLSASVNPCSGTGGRGSGVYLAAWVDGSPIQAELDARQVNVTDTTVLLLALEPAVRLTTDRLTLAPGLFRWTALESTQPRNVEIYDSYVYYGAFSVKFTPIVPVAFRSVESLVLHLKGYNQAGSLAPLQVALWDVTRGQWAELQDVSWGDTRLMDPARYVGPEGEVVVRLGNPSSQSISLEAVDVTVVVVR